MKPIVYFAKVKENAVIPSKRAEDAGYDIYACFDESCRVIQPHQTVMIPTGIASSFDDDFVMLAEERGSTGSRGMAKRAGVIDSGFRDEWFIPITNTTTKIIIIAKDEYIEQFDKLPENLKSAVTIYPYNKAIAQALLLPVPKPEVKEITYEELKAIPSQRGTGSLGSSNK